MTSQKFDPQQADDELSTSAGSSDNEVNVVSEDETNTVPAQGNEETSLGGLSCQPIGIIAKIFDIFVKLLDFLRALVFGVSTPPTQRVEIPRASYPHASIKRAKTLHCRRESLPTKTTTTQAKHRLVTKPTPPRPFYASTYERLSLPPGLEELARQDLSSIEVPRPHTEASTSQSLSLDEVGFPPGLEEMWILPPGLEEMWTRPSQLVHEPRKELRSHAVRQQKKKVLQSRELGPRKPQLPGGARPTAKHKRNELPAQQESPLQSLEGCSQQSPIAPVSSVVQLPEAVVPREFEQAAYRKELSGVLHDLANGSNVAIALRRIRAHNVPKDRQAAEFRDILTRAAEDDRGLARRLALAFAIGLANGGENSVFDREECIAGVQLFFTEVVDDLAMEVPRLRNRLSNELAPLLLTILSEEELQRYVPVECRTPCN